jgi:hypothetical protein
MKQRILTLKEANRIMSYAFDTMKMSEVFQKDVERIVRYFDGVKYDSDAQFLMRTMVRTVVDSIDALIYRKRTVSQDLIKLREVEKELPPKPKKTNLRYIFQVFALALNSSFEIKEDDERLEDYSEARKIRNRITHPKELSDLIISGKDYVKISDTFTWFVECIEKINEQSRIPKKPQNQ